MQKDDHLTERQFSAAAFTALLSPMMRLVPRGAAALAGKWAWLSVLPALPVLLLLALLMGSLRRAMGPGEGAAGLFLRVFGPVVGRVLLAVYGAALFCLAGFHLRSGAEQLAATVYPHSGPEPFLLVLLALALLASLGPLRAAGRAAALFRGVLLTVLGAVFLLSLKNIEAKNLLPLDPTGSRGLFPGALPLLTVGGTAALFSFLRGYTPPSDRPVRALLAPLALFSLVAAALILTTVGSFGAKLTARLSYPFFTMIRDLSLSGSARRFEAAVITLWVFADFTLCTLLLRCGQEALRTLLGLPGPEEGGGRFVRLGGGRWLLPVGAAVIGTAAFLLPAPAAEFAHWSEELVPLAVYALVFGGFPLLWLTGKLRKVI